MLESLFLLLSLSILFVLLIGVALWWAIFSGQFEDLDAAGKSILLDDDSAEGGEQAQNSQDPTATKNATDTKVKRR